MANENNDEDRIGTVGEQKRLDFKTSGAGKIKNVSCETRGTLNDLVSDLCLNGNSDGASPIEGCPNQSSEFGDYTNIRATLITQNVVAPPTQQSLTQNTPGNSSFSFKHFLNCSSIVTPPSTTVTSLDVVLGPMTSFGSATTSTETGSTCIPNPLQTSTGARPKVPACSTSSLTTNAGSSLTEDTAGYTSKMKRSPRFSSFDSQASLAEFAGTNISGARINFLVNRDDDNIVQSTTGFQLYSEQGEHKQYNDIFPPVSSNLSDSNSRYVPRSLSSYDMPPVSPRRRVIDSSVAGDSGCKEMRPKRLTFNSTNSPKMKLDLPLESSSVGSSSSQTLSSNAADFVPVAAATLPDFVQDHWLDSWYAHDMHLNSPPNSPIYGFGEEMSDAASFASPAGAVGGSCRKISEERGIGEITGAGNTTGIVGITDVVGSKMLPDFLSDGPIIHSSQRLADVAAGLPSNSIGSPEHAINSIHLSSLRLENLRLQRELNESRMAFSEQAKRVNELERQLQESGVMQSEQQESNKRRQLFTQKLRLEITQLRTELEILRRENDSLREEGAVGGCSATNCDRPYAANLTSSSSVNSGVNGVGTTGGRSSKSRQFSRDLLQAAANAEQNLKQLLAGVGNLRQMAADIESATIHSDYGVSPDLFSDFFDECDDYEKFSGGPAL